MKLLDKLIYKMLEKAAGKEIEPVEDIEETADGLEKLINKQLNRENLDERSKEQLEKVLEELDTYRNQK